MLIWDRKGHGEGRGMIGYAMLEAEKQKCYQMLRALCRGKDSR